MTVIPLVLDTDMGVCNDDCLALFLALASSQVSLEGITVCAGNYSARQCLWNTLSVLEYLQRPVPTWSGADLPLRHRYGRQEREGYGTWGEVGSAIWPFGKPPALTSRPEPAAQWLAGRLSEDRPLTVVAIGPLTNVALAIRQRPRLPGLSRIVAVGGNVDWLALGHGNSTPQAEFNFWVDPDAAQEVVASGYPVDLIPINAMRRVRLNRDGFRALAVVDSHASLLLATVMYDYFMAGDGRQVPLGDALAIAVLLWPELFTFERMHAEVVTKMGCTYGKLQVSGSDRGNVQVLVDLDAAAVETRFLAALGAAT